MDDVACEWMRLNPHVWSQWKPSDLTVKTELYIGGIFPISGPFYKSGRGMVPGTDDAIYPAIHLLRYITAPYGTI